MKVQFNVPRFFTRPPQASSRVGMYIDPEKLKEYQEHTDLLWEIKALQSAGNSRNLDYKKRQFINLHEERIKSIALGVASFRHYNEALIQDLIQEGRIGLITALDRFELSEQNDRMHYVPLYFTNFIKGYMSHFFNKHERINISNHRADEIRDAIVALQKKDPTIVPTPEMIKNYIDKCNEGDPKKDTIRLKTIQNYLLDPDPSLVLLSLDDPSTEAKEGITFLDTLANPTVRKTLSSKELKRLETDMRAFLNEHLPVTSYNNKTEKPLVQINYKKERLKQFRIEAFIRSVIHKWSQRQIATKLGIEHANITPYIRYVNAFYKLLNIPNALHLFKSFLILKARRGHLKNWNSP